MLIVVTEGAPTACHHMDVTNVVQSPEQRGGGLAKARARHTRIASDRGHAHGVIRMTCEAVLSGGAADLDVDAAIRHGLQDAAVAILRCLTIRTAPATVQPFPTALDVKPVVALDTLDEVGAKNPLGAEAPEVLRPHVGQHADVALHVLRRSKAERPFGCLAPVVATGRRAALSGSCRVRGVTRRVGAHSSLSGLSLVGLHQTDWLSRVRTSTSTRCSGRNRPRTRKAESRSAPGSPLAWLHASFAGGEPSLCAVAAESACRW
mmetsp:Transcript_3085/g.9414  ORF Transcript_3085/g.9414 Transcript_3085/m.9414 type:complete len:263 (+) Transcript_3085:564-1352(+)